MKQLETPKFTGLSLKTGKVCNLSSEWLELEVFLSSLEGDLTQKIANIN
jgi:hypothetical protein